MLNLGTYKSGKWSDSVLLNSTTRWTQTDIDLSSCQIQHLWSSYALSLNKHKSDNPSDSSPLSLTAFQTQICMSLEIIIGPIFAYEVLFVHSYGSLYKKVKSQE